MRRFYKRLGLRFYIKSVFVSILFSFSIGGIIGWAATESESFIFQVLIGVISFPLLLVFTKKTIEKMFENIKIKKVEISSFLIPYIVCIIFMTILFFINMLISNIVSNPLIVEFIESGGVRYFLTFLLPSSYSIIMISSAFDFMFAPYYISVFVFSLIHILFINRCLNNELRKTGNC